MKEKEKSQLKSCSILITGATGYIGSLLVRHLLQLNIKQNMGIKIYACTRNLEKAKNIIYSHVTDYEANKVGLCLIKWDIVENNLPDLAMGSIDYIIHCAATTKSTEMISNPVETADGIVIGTRNVLKLAQKLHVKSMVFLSSMEVYGSINSGQSGTTEDILGNLDIFSVRSCYPLGKRMAENYCYSYYMEYNVPVKILRLAQVFGEGILRGETRVFAQFTNAVRQGTDIVLHTSGESMGNYLDSADAVNAILLVLQKGKTGESYNAVNEANTMRICDMAEFVADKIAEGKIKVVYEIPMDNKYGYAQETGLRLSSVKLQNLGWRPTTDMEGMYRKMIRYMDETV